MYYPPFATVLLPCIAYFVFQWSFFSLLTESANQQPDHNACLNCKYCLLRRKSCDAAMQSCDAVSQCARISKLFFIFLKIFKNRFRFREVLPSPSAIIYISYLCLLSILFIFIYLYILFISFIYMFIYSEIGNKKDYISCCDIKLKLYSKSQQEI